ncbi:MAG: hypothetical protein ABI155_02425, partial [Paralcaligenes sp.]
ASLAKGETDTALRQVKSEYTDMGVIAPSRMIRVDHYKFIYTHGHPGQLYNLDDDPQELINLSGRPDVRSVEADLYSRLLADWDPDLVHQRVLASQRRRLFLKDVAKISGRFPDWSYQVTRDDTKRFVRANGAAGAKARARFPFVAPDREK